MSDGIRPVLFIGSATESREKFAEPIADALAGSFNIRKWWKEFPPGSYTLERLLAILEEVDHAVFICAAEDKTWFRGRELGAPRSNVILELGLFLARLGRKNCLFASPGDPDFLLPSDLDGITHVRLDLENNKKTADAISQQLSKVRPDLENSPADRLIVEVDRETSSLIAMRPTPPFWYQRALYLGQSGYNAWCRVARDNDYVLRTTARARLIAAAAGKCEVRTFISFGPGDGDLDETIILNLKGRRPLTYIPVDVNIHFLHDAAKKVGAHARVPYGILADFEERFPFVANVCRDQLRQPVVIGLVGNTLSNLDRRESNFVAKIADFLSSGDYILVEVMLTRKSTGTQHAGLQSMKEFFAGGIARQTGLERSQIVSMYDDWVIQGPDDPNVSDVLGETKAFQLFWGKKEPRKVILRSCFYDETELVYFFKKYNFESVGGVQAETILMNTSGGGKVETRLGVFLFRMGPKA